MNISNEIDLNKSPLTEHFMLRSRIDKLLDKATLGKLVYVIAGAGYGKTQAILRYIEQQPDAIVRWVQFTESDNIILHCWESIAHSVSSDNPELAAKMLELGFPETLSRFKQFNEILKSTEYLSYKRFIVFDDFHLIHSKEVLTFVERCAHLGIPGACVIIISRKEPEINTVSLFSKGTASIITEDELRFTESELDRFLRRRDIPVPAKDLPRYIDATKGWALAINLLSLVLKRYPKSLDFALDAMKQNIFKLLETEAWSDFSEHVQKTIVRLSLVADLPLAQLGEIFNDASLEKHSPQLSSFIWFDSFADDYRIHPLYLEFVQSKQSILSDEEIQNTYRQAAQWCSENNFFTDAIKYYAKSHQYERMLEVAFSYPFKLPRDTCEYFLNIFEEIDSDNKEQNNHIIILLKNFFVPILLIGANRYNEARAHSFDTIREWEHIKTPLAFEILCAAYSNLAYIDMYICTVTHKYDSPKYLKKSVEYLKKLPVRPSEIKGPFTVADIRSYACVIGEGADLSAFDRFLESVKKTAFYITQTSHNMYYGYDDLVACEIAFYKNQLDLAKNHAHNAILTAREKKQYSIEAVSKYYLLRIATQEGKPSLAKNILNQLRDHLDNPDWGSRQLFYDLIIGSFYAQIGLPEMVPSWLVTDEKEETSEVHIPTRELIVSARYNIACKKYDQALAILCKSYPRDPQERFLFGELVLSMLTASARLHTGDTTGAVADFEKAYALSFNGEFEMFFIELGRNLHPLVVAAIKQADCNIPAEWLKVIDRKASVYAKKADVIMNSVKMENKVKDTVSLSNREREVLSDLYHGLTRDEIAVNRYISINTVDKALQSIYIKLDANNGFDAIRIALENKLIE